VSTAIKDYPGQCLKYNGSGERPAHWHVSLMDSSARVFIIPFFGSGAPLWQRPRAQQEIVGDADGSVVNFFSVLRAPEPLYRRFWRLIKNTEYSEAVFDEAHEYLRSLPACPNADYWAWAFYVYCWCNRANNSIKSPNFRRHGNVKSVGGYNPGRLLTDVRKIVWTRRRLRGGVTIQKADYRELIREYGSILDAQWFFDPPFERSTRQGGDLYNVELSTGRDDEAAHRELAVHLNTIRGPVLLRGYPSELYAELFESRGWMRHDYVGRDDAKNERIESAWQNPRLHEIWKRDTILRESQQELF